MVGRLPFLSVVSSFLLVRILFVPSILSVNSIYAVVQTGLDACLDCL